MATATHVPNPAYDFMKTVCEALQTIEQEYAVYLFAKYIKPTVALEAIEEHKTKYMNTLFIKKKPMSADSHLQMELDEITRANADYAADPKAFPSKKTDHGYPDEFRCNFIKQDRSYLKRCQSKAVDDEFYCTQHMNMPNKLLREYEKAVNELSSV
jgi:hypothetical protein